MNVRLFFLTTLLIANYLQAQSPTVTASPVQNTTATGSSMERYIDNDATKNYFLRSIGPANVIEYYIQTFDKDMKFVNTYRLTHTASNSVVRRENDRVFIQDGKVVLTSKIRINKEDKSQYCYHGFDQAGNIASEKILLTMPMDGLMNSGEYFSAISLDRSKFVVVGIYPEVKEQTFQHIAIACYNFPDLTLQWTKEMDLAIPSHDYPKFMTCVDNAGNVAFYSEYKSKIEKGCAFFTYKWREDKLSKIDLKLTDEISFADEHLTQLDSGVFVFSGFFADRALLKSKAVQGKIAHGHFMIRTSNTDQVELNHRELFDSSFYHTIYENFVADEYAPLLANFRVNGKMKRSDSKFLWVLEFIGTNAVTTGTGTTAYTTYTHSAYFVLVMCFNPQTGKIDWMNRINKTQKEVSRQKQPLYIYTIPYLQNDSLFLIYNNTDLNSTNVKWVESDGKEFTKTDVFGSSFNHYPFLRVVDKDGNEIYRHLKYGLPIDKFKSVQPPIGWNMVTTNFINNSSGGLYVFGQNGNGSSYQLIKVKF